MQPQLEDSRRAWGRQSIHIGGVKLREDKFRRLMGGGNGWQQDDEDESARDVPDHAEAVEVAQDPCGQDIDEAVEQESDCSSKQDWVRQA